MGKFWFFVLPFSLCIIFFVFIYISEKSPFPRWEVAIISASSLAIYIYSSGKKVWWLGSAILLLSLQLPSEVTWSRDYDPSRGQIFFSELDVCVYFFRVSVWGAEVEEVSYNDVPSWGDAILVFIYLLSEGQRRLVYTYFLYIYIFKSDTVNVMWYCWSCFIRYDTILTIMFLYDMWYDI